MIYAKTHLKEVNQGNLLPGINTITIIITSAQSGSLNCQNKKFLSNELKNILVDRYVLEMEKSLKSLFSKIFFIYVKTT